MSLKYRRTIHPNAVFPPVYYDIENGMGIWTHYAYCRGPLGTILAQWEIGYTLGMDGIDDLYN